MRWLVPCTANFTAQIRRSPLPPTAPPSPGVWEIVTAPRATAGSEEDRINAMADSVDRWDRDGPHPRHWAHWLDATYR